MRRPARQGRTAEGGACDARCCEELTLLLRTAGIDVTCVAADAGELVAAVDEAAPDLVIAEVRLGPGRLDDGLRAAVEIRRQRPGTPVLVLSLAVDRRYAQELLGDRPAGVGYLLDPKLGLAA